jgi:hypothetical protein
MKRLSATRADLARLRARPSAANVASTTPIRVERAATSSELPAARWIWRDFVASNSCSYQPKEKPVGGNFSERPSVNEIMRAITTGETMISTARMAMPPITRL